MRTLEPYTMNYLYPDTAESNPDGARSQCGEEGVVKEIFWRLGIPRGWVVDCGAGDFRRWSNTRVLLDNGWNGVGIDAVPRRVEGMKATCKSYPQEVVPVLCRLTGTGPSGLDQVLKYNAPRLPQDYDFLNIDIDGPDYDVWKNHVEYKPKVVCIEINHTESPDKIGTWFQPMFELGVSKGYQLVASTRINLFFARVDVVQSLRLTPYEIEHPEYLHPSVAEYYGFSTLYKTISEWQKRNNERLKSQVNAVEKHET